MFSLESPNGGDSNAYTQYTSFIIQKKITPDYSNSAAMGFFSLGTQERVRNSRSKRAISVRATVVLLYLFASLDEESFLELCLFIIATCNNILLGQPSNLPQ